MPGPRRFRGRSSGHEWPIYGVNVILAFDVEDGGVGFGHWSAEIDFLLDGYCNLLAIEAHGVVQRRVHLLYG